MRYTLQNQLPLCFLSNAEVKTTLFNKLKNAGIFLLCGLVSFFDGSQFFFQVIIQDGTDSSDGC